MVYWDIGWQSVISYGYLYFTKQSFTTNCLLLQHRVRFDPDQPQTLRLEFAKSNTKVSKPKSHPLPASITASTFTNQPSTLMHQITGRKYTSIKNCLDRGQVLQDQLVGGVQRSTIKCSQICGSYIQVKVLESKRFIWFSKVSNLPGISTHI